MPETELKSELPASFHFSQSSLQDYADCPRLFQLRHIERLAWPAVEVEPVLENERRKQAGTEFHRMVQQHLTGIPLQTLNRMACSEELKIWWDHYAGMADRLTFGRIRHVEKTLTAPVGTYHLQAQYDLLLFSEDGRAVIYDWKTTRRRPREEWMKARLQTRVYPAMLVQAGAYLNHNKPIPPENIEMVYWFAEFPAEPMHFAYSSEQYQRDWSMLTGMIEEIGHHRYFPAAEETRTCPYCTYRSYCNRGDKAGQIDDLEAEMEAAGKGFDLDLEQIGEIEL